MKLHHLKPSPGAKQSKIRVGRGEGGKRGKTAGRGTKGTKARNTVPVWFEGGQMPLYRRTRKLKGFKNPNKEYYALVNVERLNDFRKGSTVGPDELRAAGLIKKRGRIKVLGNGELTKSLTVRAHAFSAGAVEQIQAAGGTVEVIDQA
jgi:large subunit ribosomal protein L15